MRLFDVSFYHSVRLPEGAIGIQGPGIFWKGFCRKMRYEAKKSRQGSRASAMHGNLRDEQAAAVALRAVAGQGSQQPEERSLKAIVAKCLMLTANQVFLVLPRNDDLFFWVIRIKNRKASFTVPESGNTFATSVSKRTVVP
jgi:hypothetical protein